MSDLGPVDRDFFADHVAPHLGADRTDVSLDPHHGGDFGVLDVDGRAVVTSTGPLVVLPALGFERAARFAFHTLVSDAAVSGLPPTHLGVEFTLPPETTDEQFETVWTAFDAASRDLGVSVVTGHTGRYEGCAYPMVGSGTVIGVGDTADVVRPDGARVGDRIVVTKGPAVGATGLLSRLAAPRLGDALDETTVDAASDRLREASVVRDALTVATGPVSAMHAAGAGGVFGGLAEMAAAAGARFEVTTDPIPVRPGVSEVCAAVGIDPWTSFGAGALLVTVAPAEVDAVLAALDGAGIPAAEAGTVVSGSGLAVDDTETAHPGTDPLWAVLADGE
ncbi:AIR synthase-related protein [Halorientalis litorea]|jgi:hydrogenase expression/formation protein HypE|uniref:AIR synthase-related protein n=1 Tax=Halorientalis litorea TaxID=2931977 RepID=UPI001FF12BC5|nr:AIR synthase-related protein [Halorientalis litorea]